MDKDQFKRLKAMCQIENEKGCWNLHSPASRQLMVDLYKYAHPKWKQALGSLIVHKCGNEYCVNPDHIEEKFYRQSIGGYKNTETGGRLKDEHKTAE